MTAVLPVSPEEVPADVRAAVVAERRGREERRDGDRRQPVSLVPLDHELLGRFALRALDRANRHVDRRWPRTLTVEAGTGELQISIHAPADLFDVACTAHAIGLDEHVWREVAAGWRHTWHGAIDGGHRVRLTWIGAEK